MFTLCKQVWFFRVSAGHCKSQKSFVALLATDDLHLHFSHLPFSWGSSHQSQLEMESSVWLTGTSWDTQIIHSPLVSGFFSRCSNNFQQVRENRTTECFCVFLALVTVLTDGTFSPNSIFGSPRFLIWNAVVRRLWIFCIEGLNFVLIFRSAMKEMERKAQKTLQHNKLCH